MCVRNEIKCLPTGAPRLLKVIVKKVFNTNPVRWLRSRELEPVLHASCDGRKLQMNVGNM